MAARHLHGARGVEHAAQSLEGGGPLGEVTVGGGALGGFGGVGERGVEHSASRRASPGRGEGGGRRGGAR